MARPSLSTITLGSNSNTFRTGATTYLQILMLPPKKTGGLPVALWQLHSVETGSHPHVSRLPDTVNIVVLHPGVITGTGLHQECLYKIEGTYVSVDTFRLLSTTSKETSSDVIIQNSMSHNLPYEELETLLYQAMAMSDGLGE